MLLDDCIACKEILLLHVKSSCVLLNYSYSILGDHRDHKYTFCPYNEKFCNEYPWLCWKQSDIHNDHRKACLSYLCYSKTDLFWHNFDHIHIYWCIMHFPRDLVEIGFSHQKQDNFGWRIFIDVQGWEFDIDIIIKSDIMIIQKAGQWYSCWAGTCSTR